MARRRYNMGRKQKKQAGGQAPDTRKPYQDIVKENELFVKYYAAQNVCDQNEFDEFLVCLKTDLPATFRITGSKGEAQKMLEIVQGQFIKDCLGSKDEEGKTVNIFPLPWYPQNLAWQMDLTRKDIRRCEAYYKLHNFLISETEHGTISRQETVSMIPPLLLDVQPHHKVLDMCAAPGSKTAQLLEMLHAKDDTITIPSGYVIANDVDNKRCYMLVHQAKRLNSPCVAITNHDSTIFPKLLATLPNGSVESVQFDRILCDVPCSGDGTLRKNPDIWMKWSPENALNLHNVQAKILKRGAELLKVGGRLVYSTCSINPVENEAVIHRVLDDADGALQLVDVSQSLPGLKAANGMENWRVCGRDLVFYENYEQIPLLKRYNTSIKPEMFPPKPDDREKYDLKKCMRILPHHQNTGAFFVAVLEKLKPLDWETPPPSSDIVLEEPAELPPKLEKKRPYEENLPQNQRKRRRKDIFKEDPFVFFTDNEEVWTSIKSFYDISDDFDPKCLLTRCKVGKKKNIYLTSGAIRDLVINNQGVIKFINTGVKAFVRCDNKNMRCDFRISNDGLESIYPYIGNSRKVIIPKDDLMVLLLNDTPEKSPPISTLSEVVRKQVEDLSSGSCVLIYGEELENSSVSLLLHLSGWRGATSLRCYMTQHSTVHLLRLLGGDTSKYVINKFKKSEDNGKDDQADGLVEEEVTEESPQNTEQPSEQEKGAE